MVVSGGKVQVVFLSGSMRLSGSATWMNNLIDIFQNNGIDCVHIITGKKTPIKSTAVNTFYTKRAAKMPLSQLARLLRLHKWNKPLYDQVEMRFYNRRVAKYLEGKLANDVLVIKDFTALLPSFFNDARYKVAAVIHQQFKQFELGYHRDYLLTVSEAVKTQSEQLGFNLDKVIYNSIDFTQVKHKAQEFVPVEDNYLLFVGKLVKAKGIFELLDAYKQLLDEKKINHALVFVGDGEDREQLYTQVKNYGLTDKVFFKGFVTNPYPYIATAKLLILPSYSEAMPYVMLEAAAVNTPFLSSDFPSASEFYDGDNIFHKGDNETEFINNLKDKIIQLLIKPSGNIKGDVLERLRTEKILAEYMDLLK